MKKAICSLVCIFVLSISTSIYASAAGNVTSDSTVNLAEGQTTGTFQISIGSPKSFAGCEYEVLCGEGVTIKSVTYSGENAMKAGPTVSGGKTIFSFFSGGNDFSGTVTATVSFENTSNKNTSIVINTAKLYTKNGIAPNTDLLKIDKMVEIKVAGATNPINPPTPPKDLEDSSLDNINSSNNSYPRDSSLDNSNSSNTLVSDNSVTSTKTGDSNNMLIAFLWISIGANFLYCRVRKMPKNDRNS